MRSPLVFRLASAALALVIGLSSVTGSLAQTQASTGTAETSVAAPGTTEGPDYAQWQAVADRAEQEILNPGVSDGRLEAIRAEIALRRQEFTAAQSANTARIATLQEQLAALGPAPAEGESEAPEIAERRAELNGRLQQAQVPVLTAAEAFGRADGIVREIDKIMRDRQAKELTQLWPTPLNPANWPSGLQMLAESWAKFRGEVGFALSSDRLRSALAESMPIILVLSLIGLGLILRGVSLINRLEVRLQSALAQRWHRIVRPMVSLARIAVPLVGLVLLAVAAQRTGVLGPTGRAAVSGLVVVGLSTLVANWIGTQIFRTDGSVSSPVQLSDEQRVEGRFLSTMLGLLVGIEGFRKAIYQTVQDEASAGVIAFPALLTAGILLVRLGQLLRRHLVNAMALGAPPSFQDRMVGLLGQAAVILGCIAPLLAAIGYVPAALAIIYPAVISLGVIAVVYLLQHLVEDIYDTLVGRDEQEGGALVPVLIGFALALAALPLLALVWGARTEQLAELWTAFTRGFSIGETRISPAAFAVLAGVFGVGYMATRLLQAALRSSILPRTGLDQGGQNAAVAGFGYVGLFIAGLIAVHAAGINLSGLAIVAGALSVGIGFGLQNIVQNFVSGIILLVERPVSEGDWIEVGGVQGTVQSISVRSTRIQTFDRSDVIVPNADLVSGRVTNFTRFNLTGRLIVPVSVAYDSDSRKVERILREIAEAEPLALVNPAPLILFNGFGADAMDFEVRLILSDVNFSLSVRSEMNHEILRRFREEGIEIPFPQREVWLHSQDSEAPASPVPTPRRRAPRSAVQPDEAVLHPDISDDDGDTGDR